MESGTPLSLEKSPPPAPRSSRDWLTPRSLLLAIFLLAAFIVTLGPGAGTLRVVFYSASLGVTAALAWNGWREGLLRQLMTLVAVVSAYSAGWFGRKSAAPAFEFLGYPAFITEVIGGVAAGLLTFIALTALKNAAFKTTAQVSRGRIGYGATGAVVGAVFGVLLFVVSSIAIRMLGTIASSKMQVVEEQMAAAKDLHPSVTLEPIEQPGALVQGLAKLNNALGQGGSGQLLQRVDPIPPNVYAVLLKMGIMVSREESVERFLDYPGVAELAHHPRIVALRHDPVVAEHLLARSYLKLLRNEKVVALANDPEFAEQIRAMNFDKALDYAIKGGALPK